MLKTQVDNTTKPACNQEVIFNNSNSWSASVELTRWILINSLFRSIARIHLVTGYLISLQNIGGGGFKRTRQIF